MASVFLSYRRSDALDATTRIANHLQRLLGARHVFMDVASIASGEVFPERLQRALQRADLVVVIIGSEWATARDASGNLRLADPADFVRYEIMSALALHKPVIALYLDDAMLSPTEIPLDLAPLLQCPSLRLATPSIDLQAGNAILQHVQNAAISAELRHFPRVPYPFLLTVATLVAVAGCCTLREGAIPGLRVFDTAIGYILNEGLIVGGVLALARMVQDRLWVWFTAFVALILIPPFAVGADPLLGAAKPAWVAMIVGMLLALSLLGKRLALALTVRRIASATREG